MVLTQVLFSRFPEAGIWFGMERHDDAEAGA